MLIDSEDALTAVDDCNYKIMSGCYQASKGRVKKHSKWHKVEVEDDDFIY